MTTFQIIGLAAKGFKRWTKEGMDRMYIGAHALGLSCDYYNTGKAEDLKQFLYENAIQGIEV
jgi:hypothetical protein